MLRVPLTSELDNINMDTALTNQEATDLMMNIPQNLHPMEYTNSVYTFLNTEQVIRWYHAAAGYPTKEMWL